jgi:RNA recognition motif-containing protein
VTLASDAEAEEAIRQLNGLELAGRALKVNRAKETPKNESGEADDAGSDG